MERKNICFYSAKCQWSKAFIQEISQTPFKAQFQFVSVDNNSNLPKWLKKVPTLVIQGEPEPRVDGEVMNWLYEEKMKGQKNVQQSNDLDLDGWSAAENVSFAKGVGYSFNDSVCFYGIIFDTKNRCQYPSSIQRTNWQQVKYCHCK